MADPDKLARRMAQRQRQDEAEREARAAADKQARRERLDADVRGHALDAWALLKKLGYPGMQPVTLLTYSTLRGRTVRKDAAGWKITTCYLKDHRGDNFVMTMWLLKEGELGEERGAGYSEPCVRKCRTDEPLSLDQSPQVLAGLQSMIDGLRKR